MSTVVLVVSDLMFQSRIAAAVAALGHKAVVADAAAVEQAIGAGPALVVVDLHERGIDAGTVIRSVRAGGATVLAFGRHTEPAMLRAARDAGADRVVPRSQLVEELPQLLSSLLAGEAPVAAND